MNNNQWERHNAPNGEHIWQGDRHIADIVTDVDNPGWDAEVNEIAKSAILLHNDPKYKAAPKMYEKLKTLKTLLQDQDVKVLAKGLPNQIGLEAVFEGIDEVLAEVEGGNDGN